MKPCTCRCWKRKMWSIKVNDIFISLVEQLEALKKEESSLAAFMACVKDEVNERKFREFEKGLSSKVRLALYITSGKCVGFYMEDTRNSIQCVLTCNCKEKGKFVLGKFF